jgi:hypothetical protein
MEGSDRCCLRSQITQWVAVNLQQRDNALDITKAEREAGIHPDRLLDDGRWKTVTTIGVLVHATIRSTCRFCSAT